MGLAIDTVVGAAHNPSGTLTAVTLSSGDSLTVRNFAPTDNAQLLSLIRDGATEGYVRVRSPLLHDNVDGIRFKTVLQPDGFDLPFDAMQRLQPQDTLILEVSGGSAEYDVGALRIFYSNILGASARLHMWGDISGLIKNIKPVEVDVTNSGTPGTWTDTLLNSVETLLHANTDYAVLGFITDIHQTVIAIKGQETGNLRCSLPGVTRYEDTSWGFARESQAKGLPLIPVINAANVGSIYVSTVDSTASTTPVVSVVLAELSQNLNS